MRLQSFRLHRPAKCPLCQGVCPLRPAYLPLDAHPIKVPSVSNRVHKQERKYNNQKVQTSDHREVHLNNVGPIDAGMEMIPLGIRLKKPASGLGTYRPIS